MDDPRGKEPPWNSGFLRGAPLAILVAGLVARLLLAPTLSYPFDQTYWSIVISNAEAGFGLYGLPGFYYTPVWGYVLGFDGLFMNSLTCLGEMGYRFVDLLGLEALEKPYFSATVNSPEFSVLVKAGMILTDVVVGYMVYRTALSSTGSVRESSTAFALWFLCPVVIYMSGIQAQFDCISAMLALLAVLLLERDHAFVAGTMFGVAALTKLFPAFLLFVLVLYLMRRHRGKEMLPRLAMAAVGAAAAFMMLYLPQILDGTLLESLSFVVSRASGEMTIWQTAKLYGLAMLSLAIVLASALRYSRLSPADAVREFRRFALLTLVGAALMAAGPQYCIVCIPLLAWYSVSQDRALIPWAIMLGAFATISAFFNNWASLLAMSSEYLGLAEPSTVVSLMQALDVQLVPHVTVNVIPVAIGDIGTTVCLLSISAFLWIGKDGSSSDGRLAGAVNRLKTFGRDADGA